MIESFSCIIVDDETAAMRLMEKLLGEIAPQIEILGTANNIVDAKKQIEKHNPDVVFLDIEIGSYTAFELIESLENTDFKIIFTTSHDSYALKAFNYNSVHYLLKPVDRDKLKQALLKLNSQNMRHFNLSEIKKAIETKANYSKLALPNRKGIEFISTDLISYLQSSGSYTDIFLTTGEKKVVSKRLGLIANELSPSQFFRVHKKYLVNLSEIAFLELNNAAAVHLKTGEVVSLAHAQKDDLLAKLKAL